MIMLSLDLELNKKDNKTTDIIQIGAVVGDVLTGEILEKISIYVKIDEPLNPFIITLTGITDEQVQNGLSLLDAYTHIKVLMDKYKPHKSIIQWGGGDSEALKEQLLKKGMPESNWVFGFRCFDVKTLCQTILLAKNKKFQGGLKKNCSRFGVSFLGPAHNALQDSLNTFKLFCKLLEKFNNEINLVS